MTQDTVWIDQAIATDDLRPEVYFLAPAQLYVGDPNRWDDFEKPEYNIPLNYPGAEFAARHPELSGEEVNWVPLDYAVETKEKLAEHYRNVVDLLLQHRGENAEIETQFWMRLAIRTDKQKLAISFPWHDTLTDFRRLFSFVYGPASNFWDADQGWQLEGLCSDDTLFFRESDPDYSEGPTDTDHSNDLIVSTPASVLQAKCRAVEGKLQDLIAYLTGELGTDAWTTRGTEIRAFGTKNWRPGNLRKKWFGLF